MGFIKNLGRRLIYFILGLIITAVGILLLILEFSPSSHGQWYSDTSFYPFAVLALGIAIIAIAFDRKKKNDKPGENEIPPKP